MGKAERGPATIEALRQHRAVYLVAIGGAAYLVSKAVKSARIVAFGDLGMEAIYEFEMKDMPVTVAVDATGESMHVEWSEHVAELGDGLTRTSSVRIHARGKVDV